MELNKVAAYEAIIDQLTMALSYLLEGDLFKVESYDWDIEDEVNALRLEKIRIDAMSLKDHLCDLVQCLQDK